MGGPGRGPAARPAGCAVHAAAVAFRVYDLDGTGDIQPGEVKRLLVALLHGNPEMALDDATIEQIIDQVRL